MARYAIYYAPAPESILWRRAAHWLGRDAATGAVCDQPVLAGFDCETFAGLTADPRHYGFHATLKSPFELGAHGTETQLLAAAQDFADQRDAIFASLNVRMLGNFIAIGLVHPAPEIQGLHEAAVREFERFRLPADASELARRRAAPLSTRQDAHLCQWGYPYVFEDFRFHMTLSGSITDEAQRTAMLAAAAQFFGDACGPHRFDSISVFHQRDRTSMFNLLARFPLAGSYQQP